MSLSCAWEQRFFWNRIPPWIRNGAKCSSVSSDTLETVNSASLLVVPFSLGRWLQEWNQICQDLSSQSPCRKVGFESPMLSTWQTNTLPKPNWKPMKTGESVITYPCQHYPHACYCLCVTSFAPRPRVRESPAVLEPGCVALSHLLMVATIVDTSESTFPDLSGHECCGCPFCPQRVGNIAQRSRVLRHISRLTSRKADYKGSFKSCVVSERLGPFPLTLLWCSQLMPAKKKKNVLLRAWVPDVQRPVYPSHFVEDASPSYDRNTEILLSAQEP